MSTIQMTGKRTLTRAQVIAWRDKWSHTDRQTIGQSLDLLPSDRLEMYELPRRGRVIATVDGKAAFVIRPGFVSWTKGIWVEGVDGSLFATGIKVGGEGDGTMWAELSTHRDRGGSKKRGKRDFGTCPTCWEQLPANGICDRCE